jgi:hypothetical protein
MVVGLKGLEASVIKIRHDQNGGCGERGGRKNIVLSHRFVFKMLRTVINTR